MQKKRSFTKKILWLAVIIAVLATGAATLHQVPESRRRIATKSAPVGALSLSF
uniref:hypothetical protein n=1 Tax=Prevotella sp. TaxID=59823 RepID=UPI003FEE3C98